MVNLNIQISDFWKGFSIDTFPLFVMLKQKYRLDISSNPDVLFFSTFGTDHLNYSCLKIYYSAEQIKPDYRWCDFSFSFEPTNSKNFQVPNFVFYPYYNALRTGEYTSEILTWQKTSKTRFCNFIYSNPHAQARRRFFRRLSKYKNIDSPGKVMNNMPSLPFDGNAKLDFMQHYKFSIAFENECSPYYTTEKLMHPYLVGSIPIYWGNPLVSEYFNPESLINCHEFSSFDEVIAHLLEIDQSPVLLEKYRSVSILHPKSKLHEITPHAIIKRFDQIMDQKESITPVSQTNQFERFRYFAPIIHWINLKYKILRCYIS